MALGWFDTSKVDRFADALVAELMRRMAPPSLDEADRKIADRIHRMTEALSDRARDFGRTERPNAFKRARLGARVKELLRGAGYPERFVDAFVYELITLITVAAKGPR